MDGDFYNIEYRQECQRWLGGALPDSVAQTQLTYCYEFNNGTVVYRMGICCSGQLQTRTCSMSIVAMLHDGYCEVL